MSLSPNQSNSREIRIGPTYQASLPSYQIDYSRKSKSTLLWAPPTDNIPDITMVTQEYFKLGFSRQIILESVFRNNYNIESVKRELTMELEKSGKNWSTADENNFELGLQEFGKNFDSIQSDYLSHMPLPRIIQYYYKWRLNRPLSKVDVKLKCYHENVINIDTKPLLNVAVVGDTISDNISVTVDEIKQVLSDKNGSEMEELISKSKQNKMKIQTNTYTIYSLKNKLNFQEIEKLRPVTFQTSKDISKKRIKNLTNTIGSPKRMKHESNC
ncbi:REST corepressor 2-like [Oopsacas minuta]|uniref:REST corepressor 2-like n=1 Tax=Oopsacas minuta TaxID=111878 RepID=A0AAV7JND3_9METZ|nr:REST corepressor 2-like [Oopsacas minuta]